MPEWPEDRLLYKKTLLDLACFDAPFITEEDLERTSLYASDRKRLAVRGEVKSFDDWLRSLGTQVIVEHLNASNLPRAAQLMNKTNQMNLSTRRMTEAELSAWADQENHRLWTFRVGDKFGDAGLTGIVSVEIEQASAVIVDFVLSCRVIGRRVEETMLHFMGRAAEQSGVKQLQARFVPTTKNKVCLAFWKERSGFTMDSGGELFTLRLDVPYPLPEGINLVIKGN